MIPLIALLVGLLFGFGLLLSGLANPAKVLAFLDLAGAWDPSLALVMVAAISVAIVPFAVAKRRTVSYLNEPMRLPSATRVSRPLMIGSLLFGIGWGLAGICPGPALVLLGAGEASALWFVGAMLVGMLVFELQDRRPSS